MLDEDPELQHVAWPEIDLSELVTLAAIEREVPLPVLRTHAERPEQHLLRENRQRLSGCAFDDPADRDDPARAVTADGAGIRRHGQVDERLRPVSSLVQLHLVARRFTVVIITGEAGLIAEQVRQRHSRLPRVGIGVGRISQSCEHGFVRAEQTLIDSRARKKRDHALRERSHLVRTISVVSVEVLLQQERPAAIHARSRGHQDTCRQ